MKGETQAVHLAKMMQKHKLYPEYELAFPLVQIKRNNLKKLTKGDILLLGFDNMNMILLKEGEVCANVAAEEVKNHSKVKIVDVKIDTIDMSNSKKYEILKCSFGTVQSRKLEIGHSIGISSLNLQEVNLIVEEKNIAKGSLINVDEEIAVQIKEVN